MTDSDATAPHCHET